MLTVNADDDRNVISDAGDVTDEQMNSQGGSLM